MYQKPFKDRLRQKDVDRHVGSYDEFLDRYQQLVQQSIREGVDLKTEFAPRMLERISDTRNLRLAWDDLAEGGGAAPGPDGLSYGDYEDSEVWDLLRCISSAIRDRSYKIGQHRSIAIPKDGGRGCRTIELANVQDRAVLRATLQICQPLVDPFFDNSSFGSRPRRSTYHALARAEQLLIEKKKPVVIIDDLHNAFGNVPRGRLRNLLKKRFPADDFLHFIDEVLRKPSKGIRQGSSLSPLLLNIYLDHFLDRKWRKKYPELPLLRYVDDILIPCTLRDRPDKLYAELRQWLLNAGMPLKGNVRTSVRDLTKVASFRWLGYEISLNANALAIRLPVNNGERWTDRLREHLLLAHAKPDSPARADQAIAGFIHYAGPCFNHCDVEAISAEIFAIAQEMGFDDLTSCHDLPALWQFAHERWLHIRDKMQTAERKLESPPAR